MKLAGIIAGVWAAATAALLAFFRGAGRNRDHEAEQDALAAALAEARDAEAVRNAS